MSFWSRLSTTFGGPDLDETVAGAEGEAQARYDRLRDDLELVARAAIAEGHRGRIAVSIGAPAKESEPGAPTSAAWPRGAAEGTVEVALGRGDELRGSTLLVEADLDAHAGAGGAVAALSLTVAQRDPFHLDQPVADQESYSVESRFDGAGRARLRLRVQLG